MIQFDRRHIDHHHVDHHHIDHGGEPPVSNASWPALVFALSVLALTVGFVALHRAMDDYSAPSEGGYIAVGLQSD